MAEISDILDAELDILNNNAAGYYIWQTGK
jgi:hypothetical protein